MTRTTPDVPMVRVIARRDPHLRITAVDVYYRSAGDAEFHSVGSIDPARRYPSDITVAVPDLVLAKIDAAEAVAPAEAVGQAGLRVLRAAFMAGADFSRPRGLQSQAVVCEREFAEFCLHHGIFYEPPAEVTV